MAYLKKYELPAMRRPALPILFCGLAATWLAIGCDRATPPKTAPSPNVARPRIQLTVLVIADDSFVDGLSLLRGEWAERTGGTFVVKTETSAQDASLEPEPGPPTSQVEADLIVFPPRRLGEFVERGWLRPLRKSILGSTELEIADVFRVIREHQMLYGGVSFALPLNCQTPLMCYNAKLLDERQLSAPETWQDFAAINDDAITASGNASTGRIDATSNTDPTMPTLERFELAYLLLAQAAAYTEPNQRAAFCFDATDMTPRVDGEPFVRATQRLASALPADGANAADVHRRGATLATSWILSVLDGTTPIAVGWPPGAGSRANSPRGATQVDVSNWTADVTWSELPSAQQFFDDASQTWRPATTLAEPVTLLGPGGYMASVTTSTKNTVSAFQLGQWLASRSVSRQLAGTSLGAFPCRQSQVSDAAAWLRSDLPPGQSDQIGRVVQTALTRDSVVQFPRILAVDQYLAALGDGVLACRQGTEPTAALSIVAQRWDQITDALGRPQQLQSYRRHLGIESLAKASGE